MRRSIVFSSLILASAMLSPWAVPTQAGTVVRYCISLADILPTTGQPDRGADGYQFARQRASSRHSSGFRT